MRESQFIRKIHKLLPKEIWAWKTADRFTNGIPDSVYVGPKGRTLWVEYKFVQQLGKRHTPRLTQLQKQRLAQLYQAGHDVAVIIGSPHDAVILRDLAWEHSADTTQRTSHKALSSWIKGRLCNEPTPYNPIAEPRWSKSSHSA